MKIALLVSLTRESKLYFEKFKFKEEIKHERVFYKASFGDNELILLNIHCGPANAASGAEAVILNYFPDVIIKTGSAGAHNNDLLPGDVVIGNIFKIMYNPFEYESSNAHAQVHKLIRFYKHNEDLKYDQLEISDKYREISTLLTNQVRLKSIFSEKQWYTDEKYRNPIIKLGVIGSNEGWTTEHRLINKKREIFMQDAEDKETAYIAQVCKLHDLPFAAFVGISDNELTFKLQDKEEIKKAIENAGRNAAIVALEFINQLVNQ